MKSYQFLMAFFLLSLTQIVFGASNPKYLGTPYENISTQSPKILKENSSRSGQISAATEVDFFEIDNNALGTKNPFPIADVDLEFSCPQASSDISKFGWYVSIWKHYVDNNKPDEQLKGYDEISAKRCSDKFSMTIDQNDNTENEVASYYVGIQSACVSFPKMNPMFYYVSQDSSINKPETCDTSDYKLKIGVIPKNVVADANTLTADELKSSIPLGAIKTGQVLSMTDKNIYSVETNSTTDTAGTNELPLLFSCTSAAARYTNDWKITVYDDKNTVVTGYPRYINGSDCGSSLVDDKGGFKFTLPKDSPRYFISVQSACDAQSKKNCTVETSQYDIARDVTKIYTGSLSATKSITSTTANFKLTRCGLNANSTLAVKIENADLRTLFKNKIPIKIQIGSMACQILTPDSFAPAELMLGSITGNAEIVDASLTAKDSVNVTLGECAPSNKPENEKAIKVTLTGTKLNLENLNPATVATTTGTAVAPTSNNSVVIPIKVDVGDFHCEGRDAFYIDNDAPKTGDKTYSNHLPTYIEDYSPAINLELSKTNKIESTTDVRLYYVDSSINNDTILNFSCDASKRFNNDWKVLIYNSDKTLNGSPYVINGSDCATGKDGDNGIYKITIPKDKGSVRYFIAVKSACEEDDSACVVDNSQYILSREVVSTTSTTGTTTPAKTAGSFDTTWLLAKKNLGVTQQIGQINTVSDTQVYQVDTGTEDANLTFSCNNSMRYQNDWKLLIYDSAKTLKSTTLINGSSCGTGQSGDTGAYAISLTKDSPTYYLIVKSACESDDKTCEIDKSQYQLKRVTAAQAAASATAKTTCLIGNCTTSTIKPFFK